MTSSLPERPNLEQLKKQAKGLLHAAQAHDPAALARFQILPAFAPKAAADLRTASFALHDAQSVVAREHGFASWTLLREHIEERAFTFAAALDEFIRCATGEAPARALRLLALHPGIARANVYTALVLGDAAIIDAHLAKHPEWATAPGGPQAWEPIQYVCHTCLHREDPARADGLVAIARRLLAAGANRNARYTWRWHAELPRTVLWGALCAMGHLPLATVLLEAGADVNDGVSLHIAAGSGHLRSLELLRIHGVNVNGIPGGLPALRYILNFAKSPAGPRWLLEHGADPHLTWGELNEAPVHVAARRWDVPMLELLARHGADLTARRADGRTPHTIAALGGNHLVAEWLLAHGATDELSPLERFVATCARGDRTNAETLLREQPDLRSQLQTEHHLMLQHPAERGDVTVLETMLACGFDPRAADQDRITVLHRAAMAGQVESVRLLLRFGAPVNAIDDMFYAPPIIWAAEGSSGRNRSHADFPGVVRELIAGGSTLAWNPPASTPGREKALEALDELRGAVG